MRLDHLLSKERSGCGSIGRESRSGVNGKLEALFNFEGPEKGLQEGKAKKRKLEPCKYGGVAQLGEHLPCKQGVSGSIPLISTKGLKVNEERSRSLWPEEMGL